ncbi:MAG: T9SS type A sorting domain-containing protein [Bacteroidetes bacterium]|nr:T9SS type A sorting domain-containing protein [Bacteroidota bacterium]
MKNIFTLFFFIGNILLSQYAQEIRNKFINLIFVVVIIITPNLPAQINDSCLAEINGAPKGQPGNIQDNMFHSLAIDPKNENIVYAGTETNGIFKTTDGGKSWSRLRRGLKCTFMQTGYSQIFDITVDPKNSQILYAATVNGPGPTGNMLYPSNSAGVYKSIDGGKTWRQKVQGFTNTYTIYVLIDSTNTNRIYAALGGVKSTFSMTPNIFYEGGIFLSNDAGESWVPLILPPGVNTNIFVDVVIRGTDQKILYASGQLHRDDAPIAYGLIKSTDGGTTWGIINPLGTIIYGFDVYKKDANIIYGHDSSQQRRVHKSTNGGTTWTLIPNTSFYGTIRIHPRDSSIIFYTGFHNLRKSINGLQSSVTVYEDSSLTSSQQMLDIEISESNPSVVWACAKGYYLYKSTDGGNSFVKITAMRDSIYKAAVGVNAELAPIPQQFTLDQNFPNPFNPSTTIRFSIPTKEKILIRVIDLMGREVEILTNKIFEAGNHEIKFSPKSETSGIYFAQLTSGGKTFTTKMVFIK